RHAAAQADLLGLVDDPHASPADLPEGPVVAQPPRLALDRMPIPDGRRRVVVAREVLLDHHQGRQQPADLVGQFGEPGGVLGDAGALAGPESRQKRFGDALEGIAIETWLAHDTDPDVSPPNELRISSSRSSARVYRLLAALKVSPRAA